MTAPALLDQMGALAEEVRSRLLLLLDGEELTVSDLCAVTQLPQSTVSRHLRTLGDRGLVASRPDGPRRLYRGTVADQEAAVQQLWELTRAEVESSRVGRADRDRLESVLARRRSRSQAFFDASGERWDALRDELFGGQFHLTALLGLLPATWRVADLGCGTGAAAEALAPCVERVIGVDASAAMLDVAARRVARFDNVELRRGELESVPIDDGTLDAATLMLVLHHVVDPGAVVREAARCLRPDGRLVLVDMVPHDRVEYRHEMGHTWLGFSEDVVTTFFLEAGFGPPRFSALAPVPEAKGPHLFAAVASAKESKS
jgi:ArsR family transcriptional regulator